MPPTIQSGSRNERDRKSSSRSTVPRRSDIVCRIKYYNQLPDIPFDPKFIKYPFEQKRFVEYNATSLERNYKHELLAEHDLGVTIDLINPETYKIDPKATLDPKDEFLLEEEILAKGDSKRSARHARNVSWLRKTQYISSEYTRSTPTSEKPETRVAYTLKKNFKEEDAYQDRDVQITSIQKTFEDAKKPIEKHYSKPSVSPVEILPVFPDFETWIHPCAQVNFDSDPAVRGGGGKNLQNTEMSQAMIRGMVDETDEQFVGYFLPGDETLSKRKRDVEDEVDYREDEDYEYKLTREYNWNVKNKASRGYEENYFFIFRKGKGVFFNELETRVRLSKRRKKEGLSSNSVLLVKHREFNEQESTIQEARLSQLENIPVEEEEEEEAEGEEGKDEGETGEEQEASDEEEKEEQEEGEDRQENEEERQNSGEEQNASDAEMESQQEDADEGEAETGGQDVEVSAAESGAEAADSEDEGAAQAAESDNEEAAVSAGEEEEDEQKEEEQEEEETREQEEEEEDDDEERGRREDEAEIFGGDSDEESGAVSD